MFCCLCLVWDELNLKLNMLVCYSNLRTINEFKASVYQEAEAGAAKASRGDASKKRKAITDAASVKSAAYDWAELADNGKVSSQVISPRLYIPTS